MKATRPLTRLTLLAVLLASASTLAACGTTGSFATNNSTVACGSPEKPTFKPIWWSKKDTKQTQKQVVEHNAVGKTLCGWTPSRNPMYTK